MARIDAACNYLLSTYGKATGSRYDSHKKSELRSLYNNIIKLNKESPLYKITQTGDVKEFAIDIKANAHRMQNVIASLNADGNDISSMLRKKVAVSSDESTVSVHYVGDDKDTDQSGFDMDVISLAKPQVNEGNYLKRNDYDFEEGSFSFDLDMPTNSYEFQFNVKLGDNNFDVQNKIARLINQSDIGLLAEVRLDNHGQSALRIESKQTGLAADEDAIFSIHSGTSWNEINKLGIAHVTSPASNSIFRLNGQEHSSLSNTFTINRSFEVTMHDSAETTGSPVHIGFMANTAAISNGIRDMLSSYNGLVDVGQKYASLHGSSKLLNEVSSIGGYFTDSFAEMGIIKDDRGHFQLNSEQLTTAINGEDARKHFNTLNQFKDNLSHEANRIAIDPMRYINKVIVEYKNPGKTFVAPYAPSAYAGMLIDQAL